MSVTRDFFNHSGDATLLSLIEISEIITFVPFIAKFYLSRDDFSCSYEKATYEIPVSVNR